MGIMSRPKSVLKPFSEKVMARIRTHDRLQFYEGPVRSGKTQSSLMSLVAYIQMHDVTTGMMSGNTVGSVIRNCIKPRWGFLDLCPKSRLIDSKGSMQIIVPTDHGEVTIYLFGASDSASDDPLRGLTLDFWYADEITKHHLNFVNEAMARLAAAEDPLMIWTSNPENPQLPLYVDYTDRFHAMSPEEKEAFGGYHEFHFTLEDNPIMTEAKIKKLALSYSGAEYDRKILGKRCVQEGLVYPDIDDRYFRPLDPGDVDVRYCAIDFGTDHATVMLFGGIYRGNKRDWRIVSEYYDKGSNKTTYDYYVDFLGECEALGVDPTKVTVAIDPAAKVLRIEFMKHGISVVKAKNDVLNGINFTRTGIYNGLLSFGDASKFKHLKQEFGTYAWDEKKAQTGVDAVIKQNDDAVDALRYFAYTFVRPVSGMTA